MKNIKLLYQLINMLLS